MHIDFEFIESVFKVTVVGTEPSYHDAAEGVDNNFISMCREKILLLIKVVAHCNHGFAAFLKARKRRANLLKFTDATAGHVVRIQ